MMSSGACNLRAKTKVKIKKKKIIPISLNRWYISTFRNFNKNVSCKWKLYTEIEQHSMGP